MLFLLSIRSQAAVSSIGLGSDWLKVAVVNLKPGQSPISIVINEMSKCKSPALVAFQSGTQLLGEEAAGIVARYPDKLYSQLRDMVGKPYKHVKGFIDSMYLPFDIVEDSRGAVRIKIDGNVASYSIEALLAMILSYAANLTEFHSRVPVKDAVISVPPYFGQAEGKGLLQAAQLAAINVLSLVNEHSGAALQYWIDKDFSNESRHFGKTVSDNQFQVKDVRWDSELGGQNMELRLVEYFADEFNKQLRNGVDVRKSPKAMAKLKKQVKHRKEILSANTIAPISIESFYDDRDFRSTITHEKFEELCEDLWENSLTPVKEVLKYSGLEVDDIYAVELIGGATRSSARCTRLLHSPPNTSPFIGPQARQFSSAAVEQPSSAAVKFKAMLQLGSSKAAQLGSSKAAKHSSNKAVQLGSNKAVQLGSAKAQSSAPAWQQHNSLAQQQPNGPARQQQSSPARQCQSPKQHTSLAAAQQPNSTATKRSSSAATKQSSSAAAKLKAVHQLGRSKAVQHHLAFLSKPTA
ncbi:hypothetical protein SLEP1_g41254 [Rubroshorea leprosula]|uniref:Uncharacterized protein n=1 Tax=Rubroshorea leprosula TaxID=152421 RepID=A0AAV5L642_9ROSI|nr:hypothetical protein SLEP1_g41254 [Rubroshorea leprosula]